MSANKAHFALIGVGAIGLIVWLWNQSAAAPASEASTPAGDPIADNSNGAQTYPTIPPTQLGDINIGGSPTYLYTTQLPVDGGVNPNLLTPSIVNPGVGDGSCCDTCTNPPGQFVTKNNVPQPVYQAAVDNLASAPAAPAFFGGGGGGVATLDDSGGYI